MDQLTNSIRRQNWVRIIHECHNRPSHMIAKQWMKENGISEKSYYYWQRKFRAEAAERMDLSLPIAQSTPEVTFMALLKILVSGLIFLVFHHYFSLLLIIPWYSLYASIFIGVFCI